MKLTFVPIIVVSLFQLTIIPALAKPSDLTGLSAGIGCKNITPDTRVKNWVTGQEYGTVKDSLFVRALVISGSSEKVAIVSWDLVNAGESATHELRKRIAQSTDLKAENILVNATHNHSAPWSPEYEHGLRGNEADPWWVVRYMPPQYQDPYFQAWMNDLMDQSLAAVKSALQNLQPVSVWLSRSDISEWVQNRRPRAAVWGATGSKLPEDYNYKHSEWDPKILGGGARFGPLDRTMTVLSFQNQKGDNVAVLFQMTAHAVSIYPFYDGISADWPGLTMKKMGDLMDGQCLFLQGTAGDINPGRRGEEAVEAMSDGISKQAWKSHQYAAKIQEEGDLVCQNIKVSVPLTETGQETTGLTSLPVEIQVINIGPLAIVTLPGEPMTAIGDEIRDQSPFPQTMVLGYSNGSGIYYVGMPGEKAYGGYEAGEQTNIGTDTAGAIMAQSAISLLNEIYSKNYPDK
ncbi:MAG: neutral/alkaline non-lysosomal ceramidase N-terminal domain-containing protein [Saprospiraceae bacterium]|nr:neutral/alkaline non-lysosomal ceramidase N-terminal domain-containing protein [Saprospiraceae bacterium]